MSKGTSSSRAVAANVSSDAAPALVVVAPDGGWGWVVVMVSFTVNLIADGVAYCVGIWLDPISKSLRVQITEVANASAIMTGTYYLVGPAVCALINRYGFRVTGILGGLVSAVAIGISSRAYNLIVFLGFFGALCGFGFSMIYVPSLVIVGFYFDRWRSVATAVAVCGSSIGMMVFPPIFNGLLNDMHWRDKFKILTGASMMCALLAFTYIPLKPKRVVTDESKRVQFRAKDSASSNQPPSVMKVGVYNRLHNLMHPTLGDLDVGGSVQSLMLMDQSYTSLMSSAVPSFSMIRPGADNSGSSTRDNYKSRVCCRKCDYYCLTKFTWCFHCTKPIGHRPMYRDDALYTGTMSQLSEYRTGSSLGYLSSVTRVTTQQDFEEDYYCCICCPMSMRRTLATMMAFGLMKSPSFLILVLSGFFTTLGMFTPYVYIKDYAVRKEMPSEIAVYLISTIGGANLVGRMMCGVASSISCIGALKYSYFCLLVCGGITMGSIYFYNMYMQFMYAVIFGITIAVLPSLRTIIIVEMLGLEHLTNAFGLVMLFEGLACLAGLPISGIIIQHTGKYEYCFLFSGSSITLSGLMLLPVKLIANWEERRSNKRTQSHTTPTKR